MADAFTDFLFAVGWVCVSVCVCIAGSAGSAWCVTVCLKKKKTPSSDNFPVFTRNQEAFIIINLYKLYRIVSTCVYIYPREQAAASRKRFLIYSDKRGVLNALMQGSSGA